MYYPKQIPYLLDKEFSENIQYEEYRLKELEEDCMCIWQMQSKVRMNRTIYNYILPDACIDLVIDFTNQSICFAGFSKETIPFELNKKIDYMGVRLKPSSFYYFFQVSADTIMDHPVPFCKIEQEIDLGNILLVQSAEERIDILKSYLLKKIEKVSNKKFIKMIDCLYENPKEQTVMEIANELGYEKRQLYRIFKKYYGVSPKVLLNILRLHLCLTLLLEENKTLAEIAMICGFYDQSHFIKEIKRYTGISPVQLLENAR